VVLIDEVEALAVRRSSASFETNPVDVHRATDAVLAGLNALRARCPHVVLIVMTNFLQAVDEAVLSRADLVLTTELPNAETIEGIVHGSLEELAGQWQDIRRLAEDKALHAELASLLVGGLDGRRVRKTVLSALASRTEVAMEPGLVTADDLRCAAQFSALRFKGLAGRRRNSSRQPWTISATYRCVAPTMGTILGGSPPFAMLAFRLIEGVSPRQRPGVPVRRRQWLSPHGVSGSANNLQRITVDDETNAANYTKVSVASNGAAGKRAAGSELGPCRLHQVGVK
jgi:hypothetical protein